MQSIRKSCAVVLAVLTTATPTFAAGVCAGPQDVAALQTAKAQQRLMVAALTCNDVALYNGFVMTYRSDLQQSDAALMAFFKKRNASTGAMDYHAYKTHLANNSSLDSIHDRSFCSRANATFQSALGGGMNSLSDVLAVQTDQDVGYDACYTREARAAVKPNAAKPTD